MADLLAPPAHDSDLDELDPDELDLDELDLNEPDLNEPDPKKPGLDRLAERLGLDDEVAVHFAPLAPGLDHRDASTLLDEAFRLGPTAPAQAQATLAAAVLAYSRQTAEGRLSAALALLAPLVAHAPIEKTLGPSWSAARGHLMPNGWRHTLTSWDRLRYAWREGLAELLDIPGELQPTAYALDEITRLNPASPEPSAVVIQKVFPYQGPALVIGALGVALGLRSLYVDMKK